MVAVKQGQEQNCRMCWGQIWAMQGKFAQHQVPLPLLFLEDNHWDVIAWQSFVLGHAVLQSPCWYLPSTEDFTVSDICFILMWEPWQDSWLQLARWSGCLCIFVSLQSNYQVKKLDLSHNEFHEKGGQLLGQMLGNLIYYSHKARSTGTGGLDGVSTVNMYFPLQQKCLMTLWAVQMPGSPSYKSFLPGPQTHPHHHRWL